MVNFNPLSACPMLEQDHMKIAGLDIVMHWEFELGLYKTETIALLKMEMVPSNN
jgi:hypothetical protein